MANHKTFIFVCEGNHCQAADGQQILDIFKSLVASKGMTDQVQVVEGRCQGDCDNGAVVRVMPGYVCYHHVDEALAKRIVEEHLATGNPIEGVAVQASAARKIEEDGRQQRMTLRVETADTKNDIVSALGAGVYAALDKALHHLQPMQVVDMVKDAELRGRGGAGYLTGIKWEVCANTQADSRTIICNAGEGDHDAHAVIEGMALCAYAVQASRGIVYFRSANAPMYERMRLAIDEARQAGLLGDALLDSGFSFDLDVRYGMGAFVGGEETALIQYLQGNRCEPQVKTPFPAQKGYKGMPTIVNNIETYATVAHIVARGAEWYKGIGTANSHGTKVFSLSGCVKNEGLIEVPFGTTLREIIFEIGGGLKGKSKFKAALVGGSTGGFLNETHLDKPIDYAMLQEAGVIMGAGSIMVLDETSCIPMMVRNNMEFAVEESCGKCTPCRIGTKRLLELLNKITDARGTMADLDDLRNLANVVKDTALCGLGQTAPLALLSSIDAFADEYQEHVVARRCRAGVCKKMTTFAINPEICIGCGMCARNCPVEAISRTDYIAPNHKLASMSLDASKCIKCGTCRANCKFGAIFVK